MVTAMAERLVVIGGDAAGMAAATNARRGRPDLEIVALEKGRYTSYSACGIPYLVGGAVSDLDQLVVRTPQKFRDEHRIDVRIAHEVVDIDLAARRVEVRALDQGRTFKMGFDLLHVATGAEPIRPDLPGIDADWIHGVQTLADAARLLSALEAHACRRVVVVGAGYIGLEMAEAFVDRGAQVTVVDSAPQPLGSIDGDLGARLVDVLEGYGAKVRMSTEVLGFGDHVVHTDAGDLPADLVVLGLGVAPRSQLALDAGVDEGARGAIAVDHRQRTSVEGVYAAGDCADTFHLVSRSRVHIALGTVANKTGIVAGRNLGGGYASFAGVLGTAITRICKVEVGRTGLSQREAAEAGIEFVVGTAHATSRAGYFPGAAEVTARVLAEKGSGRIIGGQIVGADRVGKRIDVLATAITARMTATDVVDLDLGYAPSISPLWDPVQVAAHEAVAAAR
ncbi:MAG: flavoprotein oxidoreductase [Acidimicrobiales bacterium]|nr:flavoprotein oxidoreductase [Acidimicrobiales bacterium]